MFGRLNKLLLLLLFQLYKAAKAKKHCQRCAKPLQINQICHFQLQLILILRIRLSERREGKRERQVMRPLVLLIKFVVLLIIFLSICRLPIGDFCHNFSCQIFFPLAMVTKMVEAWSAGSVLFELWGFKQTTACCRSSSFSKSYFVCFILR